MIKRFLFLVYAVVFFPTVVWAVDFYVDSFASPGGDGSLSAPFQTIQEGINRLQPGDTIFIRGDTSGSGTIYLETPSFPVSGTTGAPITIQSFPGEKVVISHAGRISLNKNFIILDGLIFDHQNVASDAISWSGTNNILRNSEVRNGSRDGIDMKSTAANALIEKSVIHDFKILPRADAHCIVTSPGIKNLKILNNTIYNCTGDGIQMFASTAIFAPNASSDILIEGNTIYSTLGPDTENALDFKEGNNITVRNNTIHGFTANKAVVFQKHHENVLFEANHIYNSNRGIEFRMEDTTVQTRNITILRNIIYDITGSFYALKIDGVENANIYHNTIVNSGGASIRIELAGLSGGNIKNNLIYEAGSPSISGMTGVAVSHNGWFQASAGALASPQDTIGTDPLFVNAAAKVFTLTSQSPAIDKGIDVGYPFSGPAPDVGAYEFTNVSSPAAPTALTVK